MDKRLYEAALSGDVPTLNTLLAEDELILNRLSLTSLSETPLHITALCGHLEFTRALLRLKPSLASESDSLGRYPLHLASAEGHVQIVSELLQVNSGVCNLRDQDGRIPLHLAAMRGRVEVIQQLIQACPESIHEKLDQGDSVLHLSVRYAHLNALKFFLKSMTDENFVNSADHDGNTILHLAVALKQLETLKYIISSTTTYGAVNELGSKKNVYGFTALDVLEQCPRDMKGMEIREFLVEAGVQRTHEIGNNVNSKKSTVIASASSSSHIINNPQNFIVKAREMVLNFWNTYIRGSNLDWVEDARGNLATTAALTATVAFQTGTNPPGDVWEEDEFDKVTGKPIHLTGESVLATLYGSHYFHTVLIYNTVSLFASMSIIILMISGVPLKNRVSLGLLTFGLCTAVACMAVTYLNSLPMVTPRSLNSKPLPGNMAYLHKRGAPQDLWESLYGILFYTWIALCAVILLLKTTRSFVWLKDKLSNYVSKYWWRWPPGSTNQNELVVGP